MTDEPGHAYAMWATFKVDDGGPAHLHDAEFIVGVDGSLWVSSWSHLAEWRDYLSPYDGQAALLILLFAAQGSIREVGPEERDRIAMAAWVGCPYRPDLERDANDHVDMTTGTMRVGGASS